MFSTSFEHLHYVAIYQQLIKYKRHLLPYFKLSVIKKIPCINKNLFFSTHNSFYFYNHLVRTAH